LDGLRAVAIGLVILSHSAETRGAHFPRGLWYLGPLGVEIFFVISGFLITLLLLRELRKSEVVSLKGFYLRRVFRILPPFFGYLAAIFALQAVGMVHIPNRAWTAALTCTINLGSYRDIPWELAQLWSLSVEEHFYLAWPLCLALLGPRRAWPVAAACVVATPFVRLLVRREFAGIVDADYFTLTRMDSIAIGCCLAFALARDSGRRSVSLSTTRSAVLGVSSLVLLALARWLRSPAMAGTLAADMLPQTFNGLASAGLILICVSHPRTAVGRILNSPVLVFVGVISYSLYLWQQLFLNKYSDSWVCAWPVNLVLALAAATLSHYLVERPFLKLKDRLAHHSKVRTESPRPELKPI
jgi:peptidoglycan/LPS O-acetylase OafA/YrhL